MMHEYSGAAHIHSQYSDGTGSVEDIVRYAGEVGLDFLMLTDHNTLKPKKDGWEGWHGGVMLLVGYEINDRQDRNHYLAFGLDDTVGVRITAQEYVRRVKERGGIGFLAHPDEKRASMPEHPAYPWNAWDSEDFTGIEIWNHMSEWMEGLTEENKFQRFIHPLKSIIAPPQKTLRRWDELNMKRKVTAIGGLDAHAHKADIMGFFDVEVFPYKVMFKSIRTYVLLPEALRRSRPALFEEDKWRIYEALREGRSFVANCYHADPSGFEFYAVMHRKKHEQGSYLEYDPSRVTRLHVKLPQKAKLKLIRNGEVLSESVTTDLNWKIDQPGAYRVEVWLHGKGWIFSNHIRLGEAASGEAGFGKAGFGKAGFGNTSFGEDGG